MDPRQRRIDEEYKRKLQKNKLRSLYATAGKTCKWKFNPLKIFLILISLGVFLTTLYSSTTANQNWTSHAISRWTWGDPDPRYASDIKINWQEILTTLNQLPEHNNNTIIKKTGLLNFNENEIHHWKQFIIPNASHTVLHLEYVDENLTWDLLYPEWIDEEEDEELPKCPSLPSLRMPRERPDLVAVKLPWRDEHRSRDIARLHLQMAAADLAASCKGNYPVYVMFVTRFFPMPDLFPVKDLVAREGWTWLYRPNLVALREKLRLPVGSCELALPYGGIEEDHSPKRQQREAYATILHSVYAYVCGAIVAAESIRKSGSTRDLVILVDDSISDHHRNGLQMAGWKVRTIKRIRNPKAKKDTYNEWNYSKFRLWQLTDYDKIIFIDADMLILRNIDFLFQIPEISATFNNGSLFNSGVMVIEPSNRTFELLMDHINDIDSYNGGDQGYLNEIFIWWHRIPKNVNFLKNIWYGDDEQVKKKKAHLFEADPPVLFVLHYLGNKPWVCYRDYDCNWNVDILQEFANDGAHRTWWRVHDSMPDELQEFCLLRTKQKAQLEWDRREAEKGNYSDGHWRIRIKDERLERCIQEDCDWKRMLSHFGENTRKKLSLKVLS